MTHRIRALETQSLRRTIALALALMTSLALAGAAPGPAVAAPEDLPAVDQYSDPFGPLGTGKRTPAWDPFSDDFAGQVPAGLRRRLARTEGGAALELLLAQVETDRVRTRRGGSPISVEGEGTSPLGSERGALASAATALFDGDSQGLLLIAGLVLIAAGGIALRLTSRPRAVGGQQGRGC